MKEEDVTHHIFGRIARCVFGASGQPDTALTKGKGQGFWRGLDSHLRTGEERGAGNYFGVA
jgi:hypothetical protein